VVNPSDQSLFSLVMSVGVQFIFALLSYLLG